MDHNLGIASGPGYGDIGLPFTLMAGNTPPVVTTPILLPSGAREKYVPLTTAYAAWTAGNPIVAITAYKTPGSRIASLYEAGCFNIDAINWPAGTTLAQVQAAAAGTQFAFRRLLWSDKTTGSEDTLVGPGHEAGPAAETQLPVTPASQTFAPQAAGAYAKQFVLAGAIGAVAWSIPAGALPTGSTINASSGLTSGNAVAGTYNYTVEGVDSQGQRGRSSYTQVIT